jgi:hypothetical protein
VSAFYDSAADDYLFFLLDSRGRLHNHRGDDRLELDGRLSGGPYDFEAFYDPAADDYLVYAVDASGALHLWSQGDWLHLYSGPGGVVGASDKQRH